MTFIQKHTKRFFKRGLFIFGLFALFTAKIFLGEGSANNLSMLSKKAHDILAIPTARADTPPPPGCGSGDGGGGGDYDGSGGSCGSSGSSCDGGCNGSSSGSSTCSLVIDYWNGISFIPLDIYSPRYFQPVLNAIKIPAEGIQRAGEVRLRVAATKRHKVYFAGLTSPKKKLSSQTETFSVSKAFHRREEKDYTDTLNSPRSGKYLKTIPGDTIDVSFKVDKTHSSSKKQHAYMIRAGGVYAPATKQTQNEAGDWVGQLDPEARVFLKNMHALNSYYTAEKKPVLS